MATLCPKCDPEHFAVCDFCKHYLALYEVNANEHGVYISDGWCKLHKRHRDPEDGCCDFCCFLEETGREDGIEMKKTIKIWNSKHALTKGLIEQEAEEVGDKLVKIGILQYLHGEGRNWHRTKEQAVERAEVMRKKRIASLRKQLERLESMRFDANS